MLDLLYLLHPDRKLEEFDLFWEGSMEEKEIV